MERKVIITGLEKAEDFIGINPRGCQEVQTKISLYTVMLSGSYLENCLYYNKYKNKAK